MMRRMAWALALTVGLALGTDQAFGINPAWWNFFPTRSWPQDWKDYIVPLYTGLYHGPEEVYMWFGEPETWSHGASCPFGWDEAFPEDDPRYAGDQLVKVWVYVNEDTGFSAYIGDDHLDTLCHYFVANRALGEGITDGWPLDPETQGAYYQRYLQDMQEMADRFKVLSTQDPDNRVDYMVVGVGGVAPVREYYRVFHWNPPLRTPGCIGKADSIVLFGKGADEENGGYPAPIENASMTWAGEDANHHGALWVKRDNSCGAGSFQVKAYGRIVLLRDPENSDTTARLALHLWFVEKGSYADNEFASFIGPNLSPSLSDTFDLVVSSHFRDWVVSTTNPTWRAENYLKPLLTIMKSTVPDMKIAVFIGEYNPHYHGGGLPEPMGRRQEFYSWIMKHHGRWFWGDSLRSHRMAYLGIKDGTGIWDYADILLENIDPNLVDAVAWVERVWNHQDTLRVIEAKPPAEPLP